MEGRKIYLQPMGTVLSAVLDIVELQKGRVAYSDTPNGQIRFSVRMYGFKWELGFTVADIGKNRCTVQIEVAGEERGRERMVLREFALLDSMLLADSKIELFKTQF